MIKKSLMFILIGLLLLSVYTVSADTGTYTIQKQNIDLVIKNTTDVIITYDVDFKVNGGNIPWVTAGLPNSNFDIISSGGAAKSIKPQSGSGWTGVYITLDKTYYAGETFNYKFSVLQKKFVVPYQGRASIQFTPVWWDNAQINSMQVKFFLPNNVTEVKTSDALAVYGKDNTVTWQFTNLPNGARKTVGLTMPIAGVFPGMSTSTTSPGTTIEPGSWIGAIIPYMLIIFVLVAIFVFLVGAVANAPLASGNESSDEYEPPKISLKQALSGKKVTRNLHMKCINDGSDLVDTIAANSVLASLCLTCGALFFDRGEIEKALKKDVKEPDFHTKITSFKKSADKPKEICPRCGGAFKTKTQSKDAYAATVFFCPDCGGLWLERGEYANVQKIYELQKKEFTKGGKSVRDAKDSDWLFYPYIYYPIITGGHSHSSGGGSYSGGRMGGGGASSCVSHSSCVSSCACVSCACVACACACACAGGGAAGCSPKDKLNKDLIEYLYHAK